MFSPWSCLTTLAVTGTCWHDVPKQTYCRPRARLTDHMELRIFLPQLRHNTYFSQSDHSSETFSSKPIKKHIHPQALEKTTCWSCFNCVLAAGSFCKQQLKNVPTWLKAQRRNKSSLLRTDISRNLCTNNKKKDDSSNQTFKL